MEIAPADEFIARDEEPGGAGPAVLLLSGLEEEGELPVARVRPAPARLEREGLARLERRAEGRGDRLARRGGAASRPRRGRRRILRHEKACEEPGEEQTTHDLEPLLCERQRPWRGGRASCA